MSGKSEQRVCRLVCGWCAHFSVVSVVCVSGGVVSECVCGCVCARTCKVCAYMFRTMSGCVCVHVRA